MAIFAGFQLPQQNWSQLPHEFISALPLFDTMAELKVVLYILRHTWGYQEYDTPKHISVDEFIRGRKRKDGTRIDGGIGMSKNSVVDGLERAVQHGFVSVKTDNSDKGRIEKWYAISIFLGGQELTPEGQKLTPSIPKVDPRTEKETQERNSKKETKTLAASPPADQKEASEIVNGNLTGGDATSAPITEAEAHNNSSAPQAKTEPRSAFTTTYIAPEPLKVNPEKSPPGSEPPPDPTFSAETMHVMAVVLRKDPKIKSHEKSIRSALAQIRPSGPITPEKLNTFRCNWQKLDFRGQKGQAPEPHQLVDKWAEYTSLACEEGTSNANGTTSTRDQRSDKGVLENGNRGGAPRAAIEQIRRNGGFS